MNRIKKLNTMKKLLFLLIFGLILSCNSSDEPIENNSSINPPNWIQGTWTWITANNTVRIGYTFTQDDVIFINSTGGVSELSYKDMIQNSNDLQNTATTTEIITDTLYSLKISFKQGVSTTYAFRKLSDTQIEGLNMVGTNTFTKE